MRRFFQRALAKAPKMSEEQLRGLLKALADENARLETALDSMSDGIIVCDREHQPLIYNKTAERMLAIGGSPDPSERPLWLCVADRELASFFHDILEGEESVADREFDITVGGRNKLISASSMTLVSRGRIEGTLIHLEDITDKRKREAQLRRAESLASLTTLAAGVAHEIKNPLGSISIHIQLIQKAARGKESVPVEGLTHHLGVVTEEIERLNKIVIDFLFAVRPMDVELRESDAGVLMKEVADFLRYEAEGAHVAVETRIEEGLPRVLLDKRYLKQALLNLAKNALAAMPGGGTLGFRAWAADDAVHLAVEDTGMGIPEESQAKIFEPYYTTKETGTGLGLTITFKIVREHQGDISVKSKEGEGSTFTISLPVPQREKHLIAWQSGAEARPGGRPTGPRQPGHDDTEEEP